MKRMKGLLTWGTTVLAALIRTRDRSGSVRRRTRPKLGSHRKENRTVDLELVNFNHPSETRHFEKGRFELYRVGPVTVGRATYEPGWRWSQHVGPTVGTASCQVEHVGLVLSGQAVAKMD